jgi:hypothetical protein
MDTVMGEFGNLGRLLVVMGLVIVMIGAFLMLLGRVPFLGRLPGDIRIQRGNLTCFVPLATMILLSLLLTLIINILLRWPRR